MRWEVSRPCWQSKQYSFVIQPIIYGLHCHTTERIKFYRNANTCCYLWYTYFYKITFFSLTYNFSLVLKNLAAYMLSIMSWQCHPKVYECNNQFSELTLFMKRNICGILTTNWLKLKAGFCICWILSYKKHMKNIKSYTKQKQRTRVIGVVLSHGGAKWIT